MQLLGLKRVFAFQGREAAFFFFLSLCVKGCFLHSTSFAESALFPH